MKNSNYKVIPTNLTKSNQFIWLINPYKHTCNNVQGVYNKYAITCNFTFCDHSTWPIDHTLIYLFAHDKLLWHLLLHLTLNLKHLHLLFLHCFGPQLHFWNPWPPHLDLELTAVRSETSVSVLSWLTDNKLCGHTSNWLWE